jgi:uncharacterized protein
MTENFSAARDRHLFGPGPKRILALDGGGVRGIVTVAFLERLEKIIEEIEGKPVLLGDWFDLIGGTSTGAIIGTLLALGHCAADIRKFYNELGPSVFKSSFWRIAGVRAKFDAGNLTRQLAKLLGDRAVGSDDIRTGLCVVTKRVDTGSAWVIVNNPRGLYWETPADNSFTGNRHYPLANLIRASTAAPHFFDPQRIDIAPNTPPGLFVDGGVSPHNNPSLYMFLIAYLPQYGLNWKLGPENLTVVSVGTGSFRYRMPANLPVWVKNLGMTIHALASQMSDSQQLTLAIMSLFGEGPTVWPINSELGDLGATPAPGGKPLFHFLRYDVRLERDWLQRELGVAVDEPKLAVMRRLEAVEYMPEFYDLGVRAAEHQIKPGHLTRRG